jgi:hypothetical protein
MNQIPELDWDKIRDMMDCFLLLLGALRLISRYTPFKWDDKLFYYLEWPVKFLYKRGKDGRK